MLCTLLYSFRRFFARFFRTKAQPSPLSRPSRLKLERLEDRLVPSSTTTNLGVYLPTAVYGQAATVTASVTSGDPGTPTGSVDFFDNGNFLGTAALDASAQAVLSGIDLPAGDNNITGSYNGDTSFDASSGGADVAVSPAPLTISLGLDGQSYGTPANLAADLGSTIDTGVNGENLDITYASTGDTTTAHVGRYAITASLADGTGLLSNFAPTLTNGALSVSPAALNIVIGSDSQSYGSPANLAGDLGTTIATGINGQNLDITYASSGDTNTAHAGSYAITATPADGTGLLSDYAPTFSNGALTVNPAALNLVIGSDSQSYGSPANLAGDLGTTIATGVNGENLDITYASGGDTTTAHVGSYAITATPADGTGLLADYAPTFTIGTLTVSPAALNIVIGSDSQSYGSPANLPGDLGTTIATGVNGENLDITYASSGDTNTAHVGSYAITATPADGTGLLSDYYTPTFTNGTLTVSPAVLTVLIGSDGQTYGTPANLPGDLGTTIATGINGENLDITYASSGDTNTAHAGSYAITATPADGTGLLSDFAPIFTNGTLTVSPAALTINIGNDGHSYGSTANLAGDLGATIATGINGENLDIAYASTGNTTIADAGNYALTGILANGTGLLSDYAPSVNPGTLTVSPLTLPVPVGNDGQSYGSPANLASDLGPIIGTGVNGQYVNIGYACTATTATSQPGSYAITATLANGSGLLFDYAPTITNGTLTVSPAALTIDVGNDSQTYGAPANLAADLGTTIATGVNGENLDITYASTGDTPTAHAGTYPITATVSNGTGLAADYTVTIVDGTLTVNPAPLTIPVGSDGQTYGTPANLAGDLGTTIATGVNGENLDIAYASTGNTTTAQVGSFPITATVTNGTGLASDYAVTTTPGTLTVNPYALTINIGNDGQGYGSAADLAVDLGTTIATGVNGENLDIAYASSGDTTTAHVGSYPITGTVTNGTGVLSDYAVTTNPGTLTVNPYTLTINIGSDSQSYGTPADLAGDLGTTITTSVNGENLDIAYASTGDTTTAHVGSYPITATVTNGTGLASDYTVTTNPGTLTVSPNALTTNIGSDSQTYGSPANLAGDLGTTITTGVNGENLDIAYASTGDTTSAHVGTYPITATVTNGTGLASDYTVTTTPGTLTVSPYALTTNIGSDSQTYGSQANLAGDLGTTIATGVNGENLDIAYASTGDNSTAHVSSYPITGTVTNGTGLTSDYTVTTNPGTLTVSPYAFSYTIGNDNQTYGTAANLAADLGTTIATGVNGDLAIVYASTGNTASASVGSYAITGTLSDGTGLLSDYLPTLTNATLTVSPATLSVTADPGQGKVYGQADPTLTYTYSGLVNGDTSSVFTGSLDRDPGESPGSYLINQGTLSAGTNYNIYYTGSSFIIAAPISFASGSNRVYETAGQKTITINLGQPSSLTVSVHYATSDGTAIAGTNYVTTSGDLTFPAGQTSATFSVPVINDNGLGGIYPLTVHITLSNPSNGSVAVSSSDLLIDDLVWVNGPAFSWSQGSTPGPNITNPGSQTNAEGDAVSLAISATDPNSSSLTYDAVKLPVGLSINPGTGVISGTVDYLAAEAFGGNYAVVVLVADALGGVSSTTFYWTITNTPQAPVLNPIPDQTNVTWDDVDLQVQAYQVDGDALTFNASGLPAGLQIDGPTGDIYGMIDGSAASTAPYSVTVTATDNTPATPVSVSQTFNWIVGAATPAPSLDKISDQVNAAGDVVDLPVHAKDPSGLTLTFSATGLPTGLAISSGTGKITGTIASTATNATPYAVTVTASNGRTSSDQQFNWTVATVTLTNPGDQGNAAGDSVDLALQATNPGSYALTFTATGLPAGLAIDPGSGAITGIIASSAASATPYSVSVTVSDGLVNSQQTFNWTVGSVSLPNPGDQGNLDGDSVSLTMTATDAGTATLTYSATGLPGGLSIDSATGVISGTVGGSADSNSPYTVTVSAGDGTESTSQQFLWYVDRLSLNNPGDQRNLEGSAISLTLSVMDGVGTPSFSAIGLPSGLSINSSTSVISGTIAVAAFGSSPYHVTVTATDGSASSSQSFMWMVTPQVALVNPGLQGNAAGDTVSLTVTAEDAGNNTLAYSATGLPSGLSIDSSSGLISGTINISAASSTADNVTVTATDGTYSSSQTFAWSVATIYLAAPGDQSNLAADTVALSMAAAYNGSGSLTYGAAGLPDGLSIDTSTGLISGTITDTGVTDGPYTTTVTVTAGSNSTSQTFNWAVNPRVTVYAIDDQTSVPGDTGSLTVSAVDAVSVTVTWVYSATGLPAGLSLDSATGIISGTITASSSTTPYAVTVTASDGLSSASQTFSWNVVPVVLANPGDLVCIGGATVTISLAADVASGATASYDASGLPPGMSFDASTGVLSGTLASGATGHAYFVTVAATADGVTSQQEFNWLVQGVVVADPVDQTNTEGNTVTLAVSAGTVSGTLAYSASGLPEGLTINATTGVISGTVPAGAAGSYVVTVAASNGTTADNQTFNWTIGSPISLEAVAGQTHLEGDTVSLQVTAAESGGTLTYSATGLPAGLSIDASSGLISGTIATGDAAGGPYNVGVTVSDGTYNTATSFAWTIHLGSNTAPVLTNPGTQVDVVGGNVDLILSATGAVGDTLTYAAVGLPDGLNIDPNTGEIIGTIAGDALRTKPYPVIATVDDGNGGTTTQTFRWIINDAALSITASDIGATGGLDTGTIGVATFTEADWNKLATDFTAMVNWGDGTSDEATIDGSNGNFTVSDDHVYTHSGRFTLQVTVSDGSSKDTSSSVASVSPASWTVSGGMFNEGLVGAGVSGVWATISAANPNLDASYFTASINWGDGSTSGGGLTDFDGEFLVSGSHAYGSLGSYTVTVTVTDGDQTSATATSSANVGNLYVGCNSTLTVASFVSSNPNADVSQFTATVSWGDSTTSTGTITGSYGGFVVQGQHTYGSVGTYAVVVSVSGPEGTNLTASQTVGVIDPPFSATADEVVAQAGVPFTNVQVAALKDLNPNDTAGNFSFSINWGDGTSLASGVVNGASGLFQLLGGHTYAWPGSYNVDLEIERGEGGEDTFFFVNAVAEVQAAPEAAQPELSITGPTVVPGNSKYLYLVQLPGPIFDGKITYDENGGWHRGNQYGWANLTPVRVSLPQSPNDWLAIAVDISFRNDPGVLELTLDGLMINGEPYKVKVLPITVVQVDVKTPINAFQVVSNPTFSRIPAGATIGVTIDGYSYKNREVSVSSSNGIIEGMNWKADITLTGPGGVVGSGKGVDQITVGFIQHVNILIDRAYYDGGYKIRDENEGKTFIDTDGGRPWIIATRIITGQKEVKDQPLGAGDSPNFGWPLFLRDEAHFYRSGINKVFSSEVFTLDVAAQTSDTGGYAALPFASLLGPSADKYFWREATVDWVWSAKGTIIGGASGPWSWTSKAGGVTVLSADDTWFEANDPFAIDTTGPIANKLPVNWLYKGF